MWHFLKVVSVSGLLRACWGTLNLPTLRDQDSVVPIAESHALSMVIVPGIVTLNLIEKMILSRLWNTSFKLVNYTVQRYQFSPSLNHTVGYRRGQFQGRGQDELGNSVVLSYHLQSCSLLVIVSFAGWDIDRSRRWGLVTFHCVGFEAEKEIMDRRSDEHLHMST